MWKDTVNGLLRQVSGHEVVRTETLADLRRRPVGGGRSRTPAQRRPAAPTGGDRIPGDVDPLTRETIRRVRPRTMTTPVRLQGLVAATRYLVRHEVPGAVVECGVWRGGSMQAAALTLLECGARDRELHLFDTFEGMPPPTEEDRRRHDGASAADLLEAHGRDHNVWAHAGLDDVRAGMAETGYPAELVHYHQGLVEETVPAAAPDQVALLRLDTDWYSSTKHELQHLFPRLVRGGVLILDDYGHWEGAKQAVDEFMAELDEPLLLLPLGGGRIAVRQ